jgi:hypothetical protein
MFNLKFYRKPKEEDLMEKFLDYIKLVIWMEEIKSLIYRRRFTNITITLTDSLFM